MGDFLSNIMLFQAYRLKSPSFDYPKLRKFTKESFYENRSSLVSIKHKINPLNFENCNKFQIEF